MSGAMTAAAGLQAAAVAGGAAVGGLLRWTAGLWLNGAPSRAVGFPLGTLLVNCVGGLLIGIVLACLERLPNEWLRLLLVTGFLGGLTTFSSFSLESLMLLQRGQWTLALGHTLAHVMGSLGFAAVGYAVVKALLP